MKNIQNFNYKSLSTQHLLIEKKDTSLLLDSLSIVFIVLLLMSAWHLYYAILTLVPLLIFGELVFLLCGFHLYVRLKSINEELHARKKG